LAMGVPLVLIPGILFTQRIGGLKILTETTNYYASQTVFPKTGVVAGVEDGDTFQLTNGTTVRLLAVNAPDRGEKGYEEAGRALGKLISGRKIWLEYDRYQDDKFGRPLAWVWIGCESTPRFTPAGYMKKSKNSSQEGLRENPAGCKEGKLVNEELVKQSAVELKFYSDRGEMKYQARLGD